MVLFDSGTMHNFVSAALVQTVKATTINAEPICVTLRNKFKMLSTKLAKLSVLFASGAAQTVWCHIMPELSALAMLRIDWLTQISPEINWPKKTIILISSNTNVFLEAFDLSRTHDCIG